MKGRLVSISAVFFVIAAFLFAGPAPVRAEIEPETEGEAETRDETVIGVSIWGTSDTFGAQCKKILDEAAAALNVKLQIVDHGNAAVHVEASAEQLLFAGCQGILMCCSDDAGIQSAIDFCDQNKIYLVRFFGGADEASNAELHKAAERSGYFIGTVEEDERENGKKLAGMLLDGGSRNIFVIGESDNEIWNDRWEGAGEGISEWNELHPSDPAALSGLQFADSAGSGAAVARFDLEENPAADGVITSDGAALQGVLSAIEESGKTSDVKVVSAGFPSDLGARLSDGTLTGASGGHFCDPLYAFMMVYRAVKGDSPDFSGKLEQIISPYLYLDSMDDYFDYMSRFINQSPFSAEELVKMAELPADQLQEAALGAAAGES